MGCANRGQGCVDQDCEYLDIIHFQHRCRHYSNGEIYLTWTHQPISPGITLPFSGGAGMLTNFYEFSGHGQDSVWDAAGDNYWQRRCWVIGQHPIGFMEEMLEELEIVLTPEEERYLGNCDLLLFYGEEHIWVHDIVPSAQLNPSVHCVLTDAARGRLVRRLWSADMYDSGYQWVKALVPNPNGCDPRAVTNPECIWRDAIRPGFDLAGYPDTSGQVTPHGRQYLLHTTKPTKDRVVLLGPPSGKREVPSPGNPDPPILAFGHVVQIRNTYTGELVLDAAVESEVAIRSFKFEGSQVTCGSDDPWCDPPTPEEVAASEGGISEKVVYVPALLHWAYAFSDDAILGCSTVMPNRNDLEELDPEADGYSGYGSTRLVTFSRSADNPHQLQETNRSPLGLTPYVGQPTFSPDGLLWVSGYEFPSGVPPTDPSFYINYGVWKVGLGSVSDPVKEDRLSNVVGDLSVWCDELYCLSGGVSVFDYINYLTEETIFSTRTDYQGTGLPEQLPASLNPYIGFYGWQWGFWDEHYVDWQVSFWPINGWGYAGWGWGGVVGCGIAGALCTNHFYGPVSWTCYVVADMTTGGDRSKIEHTWNPNTKRMQTVNPCRDICHDEELEDDDDGCGGCDCGNVELEVEIGEVPDCCCQVPVTVTCKGCGSRNGPPNRHSFKWATNGLSYDEECSCVETEPLEWKEAYCGTTFFVNVQDASAILIRYARCECAWQCCYPLPSCDENTGIDLISDNSNTSCYLSADHGPCLAQYPPNSETCLTFDEIGEASAGGGDLWFVAFEVTCGEPDQLVLLSWDWYTIGPASAGWCDEGGALDRCHDEPDLVTFLRCGHYLGGTDDSGNYWEVGFNVTVGVWVNGQLCTRSFSYQISSGGTP